MLVFLTIFLGACAAPSELDINVWYGEDQTFGSVGIVQSKVNILGNVKSERGVKIASYQLNGGIEEGFSIGSDLHRLADQGDFNIELDTSMLRQGANILYIQILDSLDQRATSEVNIVLKKNGKWPLPYEIRWSEVNDIQQVVQVIDGQWELTPEGISNKDVYYDRVFGFGDHTWENYEVSTIVTLHDFVPPVPGPPTYNVSHFAIACRWPGHDMDDFQPNRKWYPLGATAEFRVTDDLDSCRWRVFSGPKPEKKGFYVEEQANIFRKIEIGKRYAIKHRVETVGLDSTRYSVKIWPLEEKEPLEWDLSEIEQEEDVRNGSALLLAHHTKVTFGDIFVEPIH